MALPYSQSKASPEKAQGRIRSMLLKFGVSRLSFSEDIEKKEIAVNFIYEGYPVKIPINHGNLCEMFLQDAPWLSSSTRKTEGKYIEDKQETAFRASYSLLEDYLKGALTMVELNAVSFEEAFIGSFVNSRGERLGTILAPRLGAFIEGRLALTLGKEG